MFTIDAHLDLAMNALEWNRDLTQALKSINSREEGMVDKPDRGHALVSLPELRKGDIGLVVATQIARYVAPGNPLPGWHSPAQAWAQTQGQLAWYKAMEQQGEMFQVHDIVTLEKQVDDWTSNAGTDKPVGYILSLEGADSLITIQYLEQAWQYGLRAVGPAHYGPGRYAHGTDATGLMGSGGRALLKEMERMNFILDVTHLCDDSFWEAMEIFHGHIWASHSNARALVNHNRQFSDDQLKALIERDAVIGGAMDAWMMVPGWVRGVSTPAAMNCNLAVLVDHMDHICQLAGNARHVGIGSDLDGAFGSEQAPSDINSIADISKLELLLSKRGYTNSDIQNIMHGNWLRFLRKAWG